jgi:hypothetical protein
MSIKFKVGDKVRHVVPVVAGEVVQQLIVDDEMQYMVRFKRQDGEEVITQMRESELVEDAATKSANKVQAP